MANERELGGTTDFGGYIQFIAPPLQKLAEVAPYRQQHLTRLLADALKDETRAQSQPDRYEVPGFNSAMQITCDFLFCAINAIQQLPPSKKDLKEMTDGVTAAPGKWIKTRTQLLDSLNASVCHLLSLDKTNDAEGNEKYLNQTSYMLAVDDIFRGMKKDFETLRDSKALRETEGYFHNSESRNKAVEIVHNMGPCFDMLDNLITRERSSIGTMATQVDRLEAQTALNRLRYPSTGRAGS